jgi:hypothetical protein
LQYTIEERELTNESTHRGSFDRVPRRMTIEADDPEQAISQFVVQNASELVSVIKPARGSESIATVKKDQCVYLVRVYAA